MFAIDFRLAIKDLATEKHQAIAIESRGVRLGSLSSSRFKLPRKLRGDAGGLHGGKASCIRPNEANKEMREELLREFQDFARTAPNVNAVMEHLAARLHEKMARYNWVGFYLVDPADSGILLVGPFAGSFTPNARIPIDTGLCGAAATSGKTVVVDDVSKDPRYLSGSSMVNSEIVVPIFLRNKLHAELDVESYFAGTFTRSEQDFVESCAAVVGNYLAKT